MNNTKYKCSCCPTLLRKQYIKKGKCRYCDRHCWYFIVDANGGKCARNQIQPNHPKEVKGADGEKCRFCGNLIKIYASTFQWEYRFCIPLIKDDTIVV